MRWEAVVSSSTDDLTIVGLILFALKSLVDYNDFLVHFHGTHDIDLPCSLLFICYSSFLQLSSSFWNCNRVNPWCMFKVWIISLSFLLKGNELMRILHICWRMTMLEYHSLKSIIVSTKCCLQFLAVDIFGLKWMVLPNAYVLQTLPFSIFMRNLCICSSAHEITIPP